MKTISDFQAEIKETSASQVLQTTLNAIDANKDYNAVISVVKDRALERAAAVDEGTITGPLAGVPFIAKDMFNATDSVTTSSSNILRDYHSSYQATAITLLEDAGAILVGKANNDAFGHGASTENSDFGPTKNAIDDTKVAGGSSGGSAVVVALDIVPFSVGTDTGGSTRQPGSFNGVVGYKPTYGAISRYGVIAMASSTDTVGILAHTSRDVAVVTDLLENIDERDQVMVPLDRSVESKPTLKIGVVREYMTDEVSEDIRRAVQSRLDKATKSANIQIEEVSLPSLPHSIGTYYILVPAEVSSNLARFDGVRYGQQKQGANLTDMYELTRQAGFNSENKRRILIGSFVLSSGYYDAYYEQALKVRSMILDDLNEAFKTFDILVGPTTPSTAFSFGEHSTDPVSMYLADVMTVAPSLAGLPAVSIPVGVDSTGLPIGMQLIGPQKSDFSLLKCAELMEGTS